MYFEDFLDDAFKAISAKNSDYEKSAKLLLPIKNTPSLNKEENVVEKINKVSLEGIIAGVDSGFVSKKLSYLDLVLVRAVGAIFSYKDGVLSKADYYPYSFSFPQPILLKSGLEKDEEQQSISLLRLKQEVQVSIDVIKKFKPKYIFVDGSIVPQYQDKPRNDSKINSEYNSIIYLFQEFYAVAQQNNCTIISCVEDSRGTRFKQILEELLPLKKINPSFLGDVFDSVLLDNFLLEGERTFHFSYTKNIAMHPILKDLNKVWGEKINVFYLKASNFDKPLRVEFIFTGQEKVDEIASIVYTLSSLHKEYSYPSVLIEADLRAGLNEQDISVVYDKLVDKLGPKVRMRRNSRPFK